MVAAMVARAQKIRVCLLAFALVLLVLGGCDPQRKNQCEWYVIPFPDGNEVVPVGWVSLCVANFKLGKKRCFFTAKPEFVEKINGVPFRYSSMEFSKETPHKIEKLSTCHVGS